ncbi:MAG: LpqN/LpqT family lipoprotein [Nocardia sp.]|nr:LpqN/LpqT family lipoprotein [Nocardia sp.]
MNAAGGASLPTVPEYLNTAGARYEPITAEGPGTPAINCFPRQGWRRVTRELFPNAFGVWALPPQPDSNWLDNSILLVGHLTGTFDPAMLLRCAATDARRLPHWHEERFSTDNYDGFESVSITGTYVAESFTFWSFTRYLLVETTNGHYWIQLTTTLRARDGVDPSPQVPRLIIRVPADAAPSPQQFAANRSSPAPPAADEPTATSEAYRRPTPPPPTVGPTDLPDDWDDDNHYYLRNRKTGWTQ